VTVQDVKATLDRIAQSETTPSVMSDRLRRTLAGIVERGLLAFLGYRLALDQWRRKVGAVCGLVYPYVESETRRFGFHDLDIRSTARSSGPATHGETLPPFRSSPPPLAPKASVPHLSL
jgi:hypothetical protein